MALTYGFYDSLNHDRLYNAQQMSAIFDGIINDGVFMSVGNQLHTVAGSGMQVIVKSGRAWFNSTWTLNDQEYPLSISAADVLLTRIDAVVLEVNSEQATRANSLKIVKGTPASTPAKPTLTNTSTVHQHALAYVTVAKNTTAITNSMIEIVVGKTETPYVTAILQTTDITDLFNQWEDYFQNWFDNVRSTLDGDVALNLQNQITTLERKTLMPTTPPLIGLPSTTTPDEMFQVLTNVGDLHVWRKTVITSSEKPAGYTLGSVQSVVLGTASSAWGTQNETIISMNAATTIKVLDNGTVSLISPVDCYGHVAGSVDGTIQTIIGKFFYIYKMGDYITAGDVAIRDVYFVPSDAEITCTNYSTRTLSISKVQKVNSYPLTPAGTVITYHVSINPNAYQEGNDMKPAGYVLGEVENGKFALARGVDRTVRYANNNGVKVNDDGSFNMPYDLPLTGANSSTMLNNSKLVIGRTIQQTTSYGNAYTDFPHEKTYFIPSDATTGSEGSTSYDITNYVTKRQLVTSYAAIPANTIIEYLGKLGNKAMTQMTSYVGTGTNGTGNETKIPINFLPKLLIIAMKNSSNRTTYISVLDSGTGLYLSADGSTSIYGTIAATVSYVDGEVRIRSSYTSAQMNNLGETYIAIAIG